MVWCGLVSKKTMRLPQEDGLQYAKEKEKGQFDLGVEKHTLRGPFPIHSIRDFFQWNSLKQWNSTIQTQGMAGKHEASSFVNNTISWTHSLQYISVFLRKSLFKQTLLL